ncbi:MAG TPA: hypothetical protein VN541_07870, partial [Tepidisphaeraceae bacterium]|nr:hypothetical protein [Tepidisphaeraceae bacterium]
MAGLGLRSGFFSGRFGNRRIESKAKLGRAASHTIERLEARVLLSLTAAQVQAFRYAWNHMGPRVQQDLAVAEYENPDFAAKLNADVTALGLTPIAAQAPSDTMAAVDGKSRRHHVSKPHHPKPPKITGPKHGHAKLHKDDPGYAGPTVTSASYSIATLPQQLSFTFSEDVSITSGH